MKHTPSHNRCTCCGAAPKVLTAGPQICNRCIIEAVNARVSLQAVRRAAQAEDPRAEEEEPESSEDDDYEADCETQEAARDEERAHGSGD